MIPASVNLIDRVVRINNCAPSSFSRILICLDNDDCDINESSAALLKLRLLANKINSFICSVFITCLSINEAIYSNIEYILAYFELRDNVKQDYN